MVSKISEDLNINESFSVNNKNNFCDCTNEYLAHCLRLCGEYLGGVWKNIDSSDVTLENLDDGFVNTTLVCSLNESTKIKNQDANVPSKVIYKKYGNKAVGYKDFCRECNSEVEEALISQMLGINGISPMLYATFNGGRLEEFIESKSLTTNDFKDKEIVKSIARQVARVHSLKMPLKKSSNSFTNVMMQCLLVNVTRDVSKYDEHHRLFIEKLLSFELKKEGLWIKEKIDNLNSPLIFTHNDLNLNNILKVDGREEKVLFVDFDTASYYYRGRDLDYFLIFNKYKIERKNKFPFISVASDIDNEAIYHCFLQEYLNELNKLKVKLSELYVPKCIEEMDLEITIFELVFYLMMISFAFFSIEDDKDNLFIGAESFCLFIDLYKKRKMEIIAKYPEFYL